MTDLALARRVASAVPDPELPLLTLDELGILRKVALRDGRVEVTITPTYLGCPALDLMAADLRQHLDAAGFPEVVVRLELAPPWSSDAITPAGRAKLAAAGIAPPRPAPRGPVPLVLGGPAPDDGVDCPRCGSAQTVRTSAFGATPCKSLHRCGGCGEPFESLKAI